MFYVFGPATVDGALQGHTPEARRAWKDLVENNRRARQEAKRKPSPTTANREPIGNPRDGFPGR